MIRIRHRTTARFATTSRMVRLALRTTATLLLFAVVSESALAQGGGLKKDPWTKNPYLRKKNGSGGSSGSSGDSKVPVDVKGEILLGQKATATLPANGSIVDVEFYAIRGTILDLKVSCFGDLGTSSATLKNPGQLFGKEFSKSGKKFVLADHVVESSGWQKLSFIHRGEGEIEFALTTSAKFPKFVEEKVEFDGSTTASIEVDGLMGRKVTEITLRPSEPDTVDSVAVLVFDADLKKVLEVEAPVVSASRSRIPLERNLALFDERPYRFQFELGEEPYDTWTARITLSNPAPATGTVVLAPK